MLEVTPLATIETYIEKFWKLSLKQKTSAEFFEILSLEGQVSCEQKCLKTSTLECFAKMLSTSD